MDEAFDDQWGDGSRSGMPPLIKKIATLGGPVTCVSLPNEHICCYAQGSGLKRVSMIADGQDSLMAFDDGTLVHGFRHSSSKCCGALTAVFGGRQIAILSQVLANAENLASCPMKRISLNKDFSNNFQTTLLFPDWIWDVRWLPQNDHDSKTKCYNLLVGLAHNVVEQWSFSMHASVEKRETVLIATRFHFWIGEKRCLLYCLDFDVNIHAQSKIAVGTAMQDIRIWTLPNGKSQDSDDSTRVREDACLLGHQGVIHVVKWIPSYAASATHSQLISASDDRSVRVWGPNTSSGSREWNCLWVGWGHTARIWGLGSLAPGPNQPPIIVSSGEDGTVRLWSGSTGAAMKTMRGHACQCIWSVDTNSSLGLVVSGANDGTIAFYDVDDTTSNAEKQYRPDGYEELRLLVPDDRPKMNVTSSEEIEFSGCCRIIDDGNNDGESREEGTDEHQNKSNGKKKKKKKENDTSQVIVGMKFYSPNHLLIATRCGSLFAVDVETKDVAWTYLGCWSQPLTDIAEDSDSNLAVDASSGCTMSCCVIDHADQSATNENMEESVLMIAIGTTFGVIVVLTVAFEAFSSAAPVACDNFDPGRRWNGHPTLRCRTVLTASKKYRSVQSLTWYRTPCGEEKGKEKEVSSLRLTSFHIDTVLWWPQSSADLVSLHGRCQPSAIFYLGTKAIPSSCAYDEACNGLFVGDTRGNLAMFKINEMAESKQQNGEQSRNASIQAHSRHYTPSSILHRLHQREHVTDIVIVLSASNASSKGLRRVFSVGNDGCVHESYFDETNGSFQKGLSVIASSALTGISRIRVFPRKANLTQRQDIIVSGYFGNTFVLRNVSRGYELFRADTGGRQRQHDFCSSVLESWASSDVISGLQFGVLAVCGQRKSDGRNEILLQRKQQVNKNSRCLSDMWPLHTYAMGLGLHGETIYSASLFSYLSNGQRCLALLTGSEDCTSKICFYRDGNLIAAKQLPQQESCVRAVCSNTSGAANSLLAVGGGKLMLQFFLLTGQLADLAASPLAQKSEKVIAEKDSAIQLHFLGYGRTKKKASIDHRINDVKSVSLEDLNGRQNGIGKMQGRMAPQHLIAAGDSEGNCHIYMISGEPTEKKHSWMGLPLPPNNDGSFKPVLSIEMLKIRNRVLLFTGKTSGQIDIWDMPGTLDADDLHAFSPQINEDPRSETFPAQLIFSYDAHQMGVNSISTSLLTDPPDTVLICSGGDDQAISLCELSVKFNESATRIETAQSIKFSRTSEASSSAIKGVQLLSNTHIISVGYSQRLALWKIPIERSLQLLWTAPTSVGDTNCLTATVLSEQDKESYLVAVAGASVDFFTIAQSALFA